MTRTLALCAAIIVMTSSVFGLLQSRKALRVPPGGVFYLLFEVQDMANNEIAHLLFWAAGYVAVVGMLALAILAAWNGDD